MVFFAAALACASVAGFSGLDPPLHRPPPRPCTGRRSSTQPVWLGTSSSSTATVPPPKSTTPATTSIVALESNEIATNNSSVYGLPMPADGGSGSGGNDDTGTAAVFPESVVAQSIITVQPPSKRVKNDFESDAAFTTPIPSTAAVVVWINRNARGVTERTIQVARSVFGDDAVLVTTSAKDQAAAAQIILERLKPRILIPVGGDGTLTSIISSLCGCSPTDVVDGDDASNTRLNDAVRNLPILAYIPLGTGNAVGSVVGCRIAAKKSSFFSIAATALGFSGRRRTNRTKIETKNKNNDLRSVLVRIQSMAANYENDAAAATGLFDSQSATMPPTTPLRTAGIPIVELPILQVTTTTTTTTMTQSTASAAPSKTTSSALCFFAGGTHAHARVEMRRTETACIVTLLYVRMSV